MKIISVVGARPEFIQAMPVSQALRSDHKEILVHTGQHYDYKMSQTFFDELEIPAPDYNLGAASTSQVKQISDIMLGFEQVLIKEKPDLVIVRGDTNSTLGTALVTCRLNIPLVHIEAGERSFNRLMPEEINRLVVDRVTNLHFCVSHSAIQNLADEGIKDTVFWVGDVMLDTLLFSRPIAHKKSKILKKLQVEPKHYSLATIHRSMNTDDPERLRRILTAFNKIPETKIFPIHPRTRKALDNIHIHLEEHIHVIEPVGYLDMLFLEENARMIATDSGGVQREAYYLGVPCLTLRDESEWNDTIKTGWNKLVGNDQNMIIENWFHFTAPTDHPPIYGTGTAARNIVKEINSAFAIQFGQKPR